MMSRTPIAALGGMLFVLLYVALAIVLPERLPPMHNLLAALYWGVAGLLWVLPIRWLMLWSVGKR